MNLRRTFCAVGRRILVFRVFYMKEVTKYIKFPFIWHTARSCNFIFVGVTWKRVKNQIFDFPQFCKKNPSKWSVTIFVTFVIFLAKMAPKTKKIKLSITELYKLHRINGHWYTYQQQTGCDLFRATLYQTRAEWKKPWYVIPRPMENLDRLNDLASASKKRHL